MNIGDAARNPLGVIGLFISLIYGFANWMLGSSASTLQSSERLIIIWFIVVFPVLILAAFCYLVIKHHGKLYAPKDYKKDESFLQTLNDFDSFIRLSTETYESPSDLPSVAPEVQATSERAGEEALEEMQINSSEHQSKNTKIDQDKAPAGVKKEAKDAMANVEYCLEDSPPITSMLSADNDLDIIEHAKKTKQIAKMKELLELTKHFIENDSRFVGVDVRTNVKMGSTGVIYDAAAYTDSGLQCLEVKYLSSASHLRNLLIKYVNQARVVKSAVSPAEFHLKLVLVYDWDLEILSELQKVIASVRQTFQDFLSVELVQRSSIRA
jgi:hypothetical protein